GRGATVALVNNDQVGLWVMVCSANPGLNASHLSGQPAQSFSGSNHAVLQLLLPERFTGLRQQLVLVYAKHATLSGIGSASHHKHRYGGLACPGWGLH